MTQVLNQMYVVMFLQTDCCTVSVKSWQMLHRNVLLFDLNGQTGNAIQISLNGLNRLSIIHTLHIACGAERISVWAIWDNKQWKVTWPVPSTGKRKPLCSLINSTKWMHSWNLINMKRLFPQIHQRNSHHIEIRLTSVLQRTSQKSKWALSYYVATSHIQEGQQFRCRGHKW